MRLSQSDRHHPLDDLQAPMLMRALMQLVGVQSAVRSMKIAKRGVVTLMSISRALFRSAFFTFARVHLQAWGQTQTEKRLVVHSRARDHTQTTSSMCSLGLQVHS